MKNYIQPGHSLTVPAPTGGVTSGDVVIVGGLVGIAATDAPEGADVEIETEGVYLIVKKSGDVVSLGATIYWDATPGEATVTASGNTPIGVAIATASGPATHVKVKILPLAAAA